MNVIPRLIMDDPNRHRGEITSTYSVAPVVAVGWEGFFSGPSILLFTALPIPFPSIAARSLFFDLRRGWHQNISNPRAFLGSSVAIAYSIGFFNCFGLDVTGTSPPLPGVSLTHSCVWNGISPEAKSSQQGIYANKPKC